MGKDFEEFIEHYNSSSQDEYETMIEEAYEEFKKDHEGKEADMSYMMALSTIMAIKVSNFQLRKYHEWLNS